MKAIIWSVLYLIYVFSSYTSGYEFDEDTSCDSMMPKTTPGLSTDLTEQDTTKTPYKLTVSSPKYRRERVLKVRLEGDNFNGFLIQARPFNDRDAENVMPIGTFVDVPPTLSTLDCGHGPDNSVSNTIYSHNASVTRKSAEMSWRAPKNDVGSIEFLATVISGTKCWKQIASAALLFSEFPPSIADCGISQSCYRYSKIPYGDYSDEYTVVALVVQPDVIFTIGGKVSGDTGYVGIGFTNATMGFVDMCVCVKTGPNTVVASHFIRQSDQKPIKINEELEDAETDIDGDSVWCKFRRPLKIVSSQAADLSYGMTQIFLWGPVETNEYIPVYPDSSQLVSISEPWNHTLTKNVVHYIGGSTLAGISLTLINAALLATLIQLFRM